MKYSHNDDIREYCILMGLDTRLLNAPRDKKQANILLNIQKTILKYDAITYKDIRSQQKQCNDPSRDLENTIKKITDVEEYILKYYDKLLFHTELNHLKNLTSKLKQDIYRIKPKDITKTVIDQIEKELLNNGFSKEIITKGLHSQEALKAIFKDILTEI